MELNYKHNMPFLSRDHWTTMLTTTWAKNTVRVLAACLFAYVFYEAREHFSYIPLDSRLIFRCAWWSGVASLGLFMSSFVSVRKYWYVGLPIYLPTVPGVLFFASTLTSLILLLVLLLAYPYFVFFRKRESKNEVESASIER